MLRNTYVSIAMCIEQYTCRIMYLLYRYKELYHWTGYTLCYVIQQSLSFIVILSTEIVSAAYALLRTMAFSSESTESCVLRKHYNELCEIIQSADYLAINLYSEGLIGREVRDNMHASQVTTNKNIKLLAAVERTVRMNPDQFHEFLQILDKESYLQDIVKTNEGFFV